MRIRIGDNRLLTRLEIEWLANARRDSTIDQYLSDRLGIPVTITTDDVALSDMFIEIDDRDWTLFLLKWQY